MQVEGTQLHFRFRGKSGKEHTIDVRDRKLARIVKKCLDLPGQELFQYIGENQQLHIIESSDVNQYLRQISNQDFTAKDFRTWAGTVTAACALQDLGEYETQTQAKKNVVRAIEAASRQLGNTPAICRKSYVYPEVIDAYLHGSLLAALKKGSEQAVVEALDHLRPEEITVLAFLQS